MTYLPGGGKTLVSRKRSRGDLKVCIPLFYFSEESQFFCRQLEISKTLWVSNLFKTFSALSVALEHVW